MENVLPLVITPEGPERVLECCGPVLFNEEVTDPGGAVTRNQPEKKQPPASRGDEIDNAANSHRSAEKVKQTCCRPAVLGNIVRPEVGEGVKCFFAHRCGSLLRRSFGEQTRVVITMSGLNMREPEILFHVLDAAHAN